MPFPVRAGSDEALGHGLSLLGRAPRGLFDVDRALLAVPPRWRHWVTQRRAVAAFLQTRRRVPAYRLFLAEQGGLAPPLFANIPVMDRDNYLGRHRLETTLLGGRFPWQGAVLEGGSSIRGPAERTSTLKLFREQARLAFGNEGFVLVNALAPGARASDLDLALSSVGGCVLQSVGADVDAIIVSLQRLGPGYRYVVVASASVLQALGATVLLDWSRIEVCAIADEGLDESLRGGLNRSFRRTIAVFGAADLDLNLAVETDVSIALRQAIALKPELSRALFSGRPLPMIYQYNPFNYYIENGEDGHLIFTVNRLKTLSPRIRFDLKEQGMVAAAADIETLCRDFGVALPRPSALPLLFHWGRVSQC